MSFWGEVADGLDELADAMASGPMSARQATCPCGMLDVMVFSIPPGASYAVCCLRCHHRCELSEPEDDQPLIVDAGS
jgi:hypothetical protein